MPTSDPKGKDKQDIAEADTVVGADAYSGASVEGTDDTAVAVAAYRACSDADAETQAAPEPAQPAPSVETDDIVSALDAVAEAAASEADDAEARVESADAERGEG